MNQPPLKEAGSFYWPYLSRFVTQVYRQDDIQEAFKVAIEAKGAIKVVVDLT